MGFEEGATVTVTQQLSGCGAFSWSPGGNMKCPGVFCFVFVLFCFLLVYSVQAGAGESRAGEECCKDQLSYNTRTHTHTHTHSLAALHNHTGMAPSHICAQS